MYSRTAALPLIALTALLALPTPAGAATRTVTVADDFFSPNRLSVAQGTTIKWRWSRANSDTHDVFLNRKPRGVKRFHSPPAKRSFTFERKLRKAGTYRLLCTFHDGMTMRIDVQ